VSRDKSVKRSAQDDDFVGVLKKNIPNKLALMGRTTCHPPTKCGSGFVHISAASRGEWNSDRKNIQAPAQHPKRISFADELKKFLAVHGMDE
jgi:hypothetical protein